MNFRIANTFSDSLDKLSNDEQKAVKTTVFDLQMNPANPGFQFHRVDKARDKNFWSVRVNNDLRIIVHKTDASLLLCYVNHHDQAYAWAERRKMQTHPKTGAAQLVEIRETVKEIEIPKYVEQEKPLHEAPPLFGDISKEELAGYGIPEEWIPDVKTANEARLLQLVDYLPEEAGEALLQLATGEKPKPTVLPVASTDPFEHPDAQRRFRVMKNKEELERALAYPWEKWSVFLHPEQQSLVEQEFSGPARVSGTAGTGKTVVALHRAVHFAQKYPESLILLTTFSENLANMLRNKMNRLISQAHEPKLAERIRVYAMDEMGQSLYKKQIGKATFVEPAQLEAIIAEASGKIAGHRFSRSFLSEEWSEVVDAWQIQSWEDYRNIKRLGRKKRLPEKQRATLWQIFQEVENTLDEKKLLTKAKMFHQLAAHFQKQEHVPFDYIIVDEAQDINIPQLTFLAAMGRNRPNSLFFTGDLGQRIFQPPFSWKTLGVNIRGRSKTLKINYRTSHQIRMQADRLLDNSLTDVDGNVEKRQGTISVFNGPKPDIQVMDDTNQETQLVADKLREFENKGVLPHETGVFVRSREELQRAREAIEKSGHRFRILDHKTKPEEGSLSLSTMHLAKGLEFKAVIVMACDDEIIPHQQRIEEVGDDSDLEEVYNTERNLLYVACTRARDHLMVTGVNPASEFLEDMGG